MTSRRTARERGFLNSLVSRLEAPSDVFEHIKFWHPVGPWNVAVFTPYGRKLVCRRYFNVNELVSLHLWLLSFEPEFKLIQWFVTSGKDARQE